MGLCWLVGAPPQNVAYPINTSAGLATEYQLDKEFPLPRLWMSLSSQKRILLTTAVPMGLDASIH